ncbi:DUF6518 family protein [Patulibacter sp. SYSU D01012]|uniref:DUF6518 family protein n=1 Tax=Patulibacter sp. SYSU D01012 TaxID=2817381 RepID=UPI001B3126E1|nr:DUF6518 family protein [Patulibacter sp. SYSU D01012]
MSSVAAPAPPPSARPGLRTAPQRALLAVVAGLLVGSLTAFGQAVMPGMLNALVNSVAAWLVAPWLVGRTTATARGAAAAGLAVCALQVVGYYVTNELRGYSTGSAAIVAMWVGCAVVGGPVLAVAGRLGRVGAPAVRGLGGATLAAVFLAEGAWTYAGDLGYWDTAALWWAIGGGIALATLRGGRDWRWLPACVLVGLAGEALLGAVVGALA